jgi:hypothetical protein
LHSTFHVGSGILDEKNVWIRIRDIKSRIRNTALGFNIGESWGKLGLKCPKDSDIGLIIGLETAAPFNKILFNVLNYTKHNNAERPNTMGKIRMTAHNLSTNRSEQKFLAGMGIIANQFQSLMIKYLSV